MIQSQVHINPPTYEEIYARLNVVWQRRNQLFAEADRLHAESDVFDARSGELHNKARRLGDEIAVAIDKIEEALATESALHARATPPPIIDWIRDPRILTSTYLRLRDWSIANEHAKAMLLNTFSKKRDAEVLIDEAEILAIECIDTHLHKCR
jgi:hypothetical protein